MKQQLTLAFLFSAVLYSATVMAEEPISIQDFVRHSQYSAAKISPNGKYLAITVDQEGQKLLTTLDIAKMEVVHNTRLPEDKSVQDFYWVGPERLVFNASKNFGSYAAPFLTGEWYALNADGTQPRTLLSYHASSNRIEQGKVAQRSESFSVLETDPKDSTKLLMSVGGQNYSAVVSLDTFSGQRRELARLNEENCSFALDRERHPAYAVCVDSKNSSGQYETVTKLYRLGTDGKWTVANDSQSAGTDLMVLDTSPTGKIYALSQSKNSPGAFGTIDPATGKFTQIFQDKVSDPSGYVQAADGHTVIGVITSTTVPRVELVDGDSPDTALYVSIAKSFPGAFVDFTSATADGKQIVVSVNSDSNPGELYLYDRDTGKARFLIRNRMWLDPARMASVKSFAVKTRDGLTVYGYLTIPKGSNGKNMPLIVNPHGGPIGPRDNWTFNPETQLLASRGYAVLQVNYRGSGGYGKAFEDKGYGQWAQGIMNDVIDATQWAIDKGYADKERICIYGGSFGGYASLMAPVRAPTMFKCAFGYVGLYDAQIQMTKSDTSKNEDGRRFLLRALGNTRAEQDAMSPITYANQLKLPIYLAAGARDPRCPPEHTEAMAKALTAAGNPPEGVIIMPGEMHGYYKEENNLKLYTEMLAFFNEHIGGTVKVGGVEQQKSAAN